MFHISCKTEQSFKKGATLWSLPAHLWGQSQENNLGSSERCKSRPECPPSTASRPSSDCSAALRRRQSNGEN